MATPSAFDLAIMSAGLGALGQSGYRPFSAGPATFGGALGAAGTQGLETYLALQAQQQKAEQEAAKRQALEQYRQSQLGLGRERLDLQREKMEQPSYRPATLYRGEQAVPAAFNPREASYTVSGALGPEPADPELYGAKPPKGGASPKVKEFGGRMYQWDAAAGAWQPAPGMPEPGAEGDAGGGIFGGQGVADERAAALLRDIAVNPAMMDRPGVRQAAEYAYNALSIGQTEDRETGEIIEYRREVPPYVAALAERFNLGAGAGASPPAGSPAPAGGEAPEQAPGQESAPVAGLGGESRKVIARTDVRETKTERARAQFEESLVGNLQRFEEIADMLNAPPESGALSVLPGTDVSGIEGWMRGAGAEGVLRQIAPRATHEALGVEQLRAHKLKRKFEVAGTQLVKFITNETSRFSNQEREMVREIVGNIKATEDVEMMKSGLREIVNLLLRKAEQ